MPTYEYACKECGENFEAVQSFADKPLKKHTGGCGGGPVQKVFHASGVVFKGSGFYATDSRSKASSTKSSSSDSTKTKKTSDGDSKSTASSTTSKSDAAAD